MINSIIDDMPRHYTWRSETIAASRKSRGPSIGSLRQRALAAGLSYATVYQRIQQGWSITQALTVPKMKPGFHFDSKKGFSQEQLYRRKYERILGK
jgi:hypothetical protein